MHTFFNALLQTKVKNSLQKRQLQSGNVIFLKQQFRKKWAFKQEVFFCFCPLKLFFLLLTAKDQTTIVDWSIFKRHPHVAKAFSYPRHIYKHVEHHGKLTFLRLKVDKTKSI